MAQQDNQQKPPTSGGRDVQNGGQGFGGGEQGEMLEGSLTDGGSVPGDDSDEDRAFGAGRSDPGGPAPQGAGDTDPNGQGQAAPSDASLTDGDAGPSGEHSGYGNTPDR